MEHAASTTLIRGKEGAFPVEPLTEWLETSRGAQLPRSSDDRQVRTNLITEGRVVFLLLFGIYFVVSWLLDFKYRTFAPDAFLHMANGFYILYSRDPHLAAVGFVWPPLQSIATTVLLLGNHLWPALAHNDMSGSMVSSIATAGTAFQILAALREWGVGRIPRLALVACFALNPMILLYAGSGMSEGLYMFTMVASTRYLMRWIHKGDLRSLVYAAVALSFTYLVRYETLGGLVLAIAVVAIVSFSRAEGSRQSRFKTSIADLVVFTAPPFVAIAGWAIATYVITGVFFGEFSSVYSQAAHVHYELHIRLHARLLYELHSLGALGPLLPVLLVASAAAALVRRDSRLLAPMALLGGALGADMLLWLKGSITAGFRYFILAVPLEVLVVGGLVAAVMVPRSGHLNNPASTRVTRVGIRALRSAAALALIVGIMIPTAVTTAAGMFNPSVGIYESEQLGFIVHSHPSQSDIGHKNNYGWILAMGVWLTSRHLPNGDVVVDNFASCISQLVTTSNQPKLFVIPNDRDFQRILADPISFHVHYILENDPNSGPPTAVSIQYPKLWTTGAGFTELAHEFPLRADCPGMRLFRVLRHSSEVT